MQCDSDTEFCLSKTRNKSLLFRGFFAGAHILGKELNKLKNKGLLAEPEDDKQTGYGSDESIAEGEIQNKTVATA